MIDKKVYIALVGGQNYPIYIGAKDVQADVTVFICSNESEQDTKLLIEELGIEPHILKVYAKNYEKIKKKAAQCFEAYKDYKEIVFNLTGGPKLWTIPFYDAFKDNVNTTFIYVSQNCRIWNLKTKESHFYPFDMRAQFRLKNNPLANYNEFSDYTEEDFEAIKQIRQLRQFSIPEFNALTDGYAKHNHKTSYISPGGSVLEWDKEKKSFHIVLKGKKASKEEVLSSPHIFSLLLHAGWFELEVAQLLNGWDKAEDILMNCIFRAQNNVPKNEIDIIVQTANKLIFVECKIQIFESTMIDKFASAVKNYGGIGSKGLFVTDSAMREQDLEKCIENHIIPFSFTNKYQNRIAKETLYKLLDENLNVINKK